MLDNPIGVYAFTGANALGNLAGVCVLEEWPTDELMQKMAAEFGASETAFVVRAREGFDLRWFTPTTEVSLCGHGTMATAHLLWHRGLAEKNKKLFFHTKSGPLECQLIDSEKIQMSFPVLRVEAAQAPDFLFASLGIKNALYVGKSDNYFVIEVENERQIKGLVPNFYELKKVGARGFLITARSHEPPYDFVSRCFFPEEGIPEDPVTGSAHCALGPYWKERLGKNKFFAYQASAQGGVLEIEVLEKRVLLSGSAKIA